MFGKLLIVFTVVPLIELAILIKTGQWIGFWPTVFIIAGTGVIGITLAKSQGLRIITQLQGEMQQGIVPGDQIINGLCVLVGGAMLLTPGLITDTIGFILIIPFTREPVKLWLKKMLKKWIDEGKINFRIH